MHASAGKLAQLLGEVIMHHAPWTAEVNEQTRRRITDDWLERLEQHGSSILAPLMDQIKQSTDPPAEVVHLLEAAANPSAQFGATIQQFFIYGVMFNLASTALGPFVQVLANELWSQFPERPLSPPDIATMVVRNIEPGQTATTAAPGWALTEALNSGVDNERFQALVDATGMPPDTTSLFEMVRRSIIDETQLDQGIREGDTRDEWIPFVSKLRYVTPSPIDLVASAVQNQIDYSTANDLAAQLGLEPAGFINDNPDWFKLLYDTHGRPPGPVELGHAAQRGFIPWTGTGPDATTFQQGISESDLKDKWTPVLQQLAAYFPPPGEVKTLLEHGAIDPEQAQALWAAGGVPANLAAAYAHVAQFEQVTTDKAVAKGDILSLVQAQAISDETATSMLQRVGYGPDTAPYLVALAHLHYELETLRTAVSRIATLYTSFKITAVEAQNGFQSLGLPPGQVSQLLATLSAQRANEVVIPTASQVASALYYGIIDQAAAMTRLEALGYLPDDAWLVLSVRMHEPLPDAPPGVVLPGTQRAQTSIGAAESAIESALTALGAAGYTQTRAQLAAALLALETANGDLSAGR